MTEHCQDIGASRRSLCTHSLRQLSHAKLHANGGQGQMMFFPPPPFDRRSFAQTAITVSFLAIGIQQQYNRVKKYQSQRIAGSKRSRVKEY